MGKSLVECKWCGKEFLKDNRHINENKKLGNNCYCSRSCQSFSRNRRIELVCENKNCRNRFDRAPNDISSHNFCSRSCAAVINNERRWGIKKSKIILSEDEKRKRQLQASEKYWNNYWSEHSHKYIICQIQNFVSKNGRIPLKREFYGIYKPARKYFGTWNKAIEAAGFKSNPVMFAEKQVAKDGHICDSIAEKLIDDYLFNNKITHDRSIPYPEGEYTADFKIGDRLIEYFGLAGEHKRYDELREIKLEIAKKYKLELVEIYPKDLFSKNGLEKILGV